MAHDEIKLDYGLAEQMSRTFHQGGEDLQDVVQEMQSIANMMEEGALLGRGGTAFVDAIRSKLTPSLSKLIEKFQELEEDVKAAVEYMREADDTSRSQFGS
ncbi:WXG100 family type VII secretion target [Chloroflexales bacterium ZM16-3]|nr:WXG100 family type VII secretion target [Chloroflexales bacterium ZM16-3]